MYICLLAGEVFDQISQVWFAMRDFISNQINIDNKCCSIDLLACIQIHENAFYSFFMRSLCYISFLHLTFYFADYLLYRITQFKYSFTRARTHTKHAYTQNMLVDNPVSQHTHSKFHASFLLFNASVLNEMDFILIITNTRTHCECAANAWFDFFY